MMDIVEELRDLANEWFECCGDIHEPILNAANFIESQAAEIARLREALTANYVNGSDPLGTAKYYSGIRSLPEDVPVRELCEKHGYGAVMDSASRQWLLKDPLGAFLVGTCASTWRAALAKEPT